MNQAIIGEGIRGPLRKSRTLKLSWSRALDTAHLWWQRARTRRQLAELDDRMLMDVGLDRVEAGREAAKPFWRA